MTSTIPLPSLPPSTDPLQILPGQPMPLGVSETPLGLNFAVFTRFGTEVSLVLFISGHHDPIHEIPLDPHRNRTGQIWHVQVDGLASGVRYGWRVDRKPVPQDKLHRFDARDVLLDPYAPAITGGSNWGEIYSRRGEKSVPHGTRRRSLYWNRVFDWQGVTPPRVAAQDKVIYELHLRGFTRHPSSGVQHPGSYLGLIEKIPYLKELGVTTVELLPVYEFDENEQLGANPLTGARLLNYWGYNPIGFFAPKAAYATDGRDGNQITEFKTLVRELHRAGIEVFLDVVFNHTAEARGRPGDPTFSFRGLDNATYYMVDPATGKYLDYSGCGNTFNCNHPVVRELILHALRYWVAEMRVDGFRFDLASILGRGQDELVLANPPLIERIAYDPVLADTTIIAEAWDAAGLFQVGSFPSWGRWGEWNSLFRDEVRQFLRGSGRPDPLATRLAGSSDLYENSGRSPTHSINFITCHDGFTLQDLVSYNRKHNQENGEQNRDGAPSNLSWNCGAEGPSSNPEILRLRAQQTRNFLTVLMLSQGTPMLLAGDELGRTQRGNNNAYCQDNETSWIDWDLLRENADLFRFTRLLIGFRKTHPVVRRTDFLDGNVGGGRPDVAWHGTRLNQPAWGTASHVLALHLAGEHAPEPDCDLYLAVNSSSRSHWFELPAPPSGAAWLQVIDTAEASPGDIAEPGCEPPVTGARRLVKGHSCLVLRSGVSA